MRPTDTPSNTTNCNGSAAPLCTPEEERLERAVLSVFILEPAQLLTQAEKLDKNAFSGPNNGKIFSEMVEMFNQGEKIDVYTLSMRPNLRGLARQIANLTTTVDSGAHLPAHVRKLMEISGKRQLRAFAAEMAAKAMQDDFDLDKLVAWSSSRLSGIQEGQIAGSGPVHCSEALKLALANVEARIKARQDGGTTGIPTGLETLDSLTGGGWHGGQLVVVGGRPGMGKTALMLHFARTAAQTGFAVCVFSLEMTNAELGDRLLLGEAEVDRAKYKTGQIEAAEWTEIERANGVLSRLPIYLHDAPGLTLRDIRTQCAVMRKRGRCDMVMIDYLQLIDTVSERRSTREREVAELSRGAKMLAKELEAPVMLFSQLNREAAKSDVPSLADLRESGAIEQDADMVLLIDRPAAKGVATIETAKFGVIDTEGLARLYIPKHRNGQTGMLYLRHNRDLTRFEEYGRNRPEGQAAEDAPEDASPF